MRHAAAPHDKADFGAAKRVATYPVAVHESEEGFCVWVPGMPGCVSQGDTEEDALANIADALRDYVEVTLDNIKRSGVKAREIEIAM